MLLLYHHEAKQAGRPTTTATTTTTETTETTGQQPSLSLELHSVTVQLWSSPGLLRWWTSKLATNLGLQITTPIQHWL
jgi:hypothetical protein